MSEIQEERKLEISAASINHLNSIRKWTMFFSILGFIGLGIILIIGLSLGSFMTVFTPKIAGAGGVQATEALKSAGHFTGIIIIIAILLFIVIYIIPLLFLVRFSRHTTHAIAHLDANELEIGFKNLRRYWIYIGILIILSLAVYLTAFIFFGSTLSQIQGLS